MKSVRWNLQGNVVRVMDPDGWSWEVWRDARSGIEWLRMAMERGRRVNSLDSSTLNEHEEEDDDDDDNNNDDNDKLAGKREEK